jgi:ATP-dependent DNA helicase RecQ/Werner syndrome ATP-dependent helicase
MSDEHHKAMRKIQSLLLLLVVPRREAFLLVTQRLQQRETMNAAATTDDEDFGDVSFLASFDVDQAVTAHRSSLDSSTAKENAANAALVTSIDLAAVERNAKKRKASSAEVLPADEGALLRKTLLKTFGYNDFREGQLEVIQALLQQRDAAVFWATGQGKSLCYQIPALHRNQVAIVVSPLISLMQDQCHKLNALAAGPPVAAFLGSAQTDRNVEVQAFRGAFSLVYLTPEKLVSSLDRFAQLHQEHKRICLIAIDEAHTVSEWGTDFRPDFRKLDSLRQHAVLSSIPLLALTASAVPRVQADITTVLQLHNPIVSQQSLDRKNLRLAVHPRPANPLSALQPYIQRWNAPTVRPAQESTIIYVATRNQVNELSSLLQQHVHNPAVIVGAYHAGLSAAIRAHAHTAFLTGQWTVLVATVAFGMGIDKPDTRRILHYGPPKTMEEYYQQIGRAGRDGAAAEAVLYTRASDFDKYSSDFYVGNLSGAVRQATLDSTHALRDYALCRSHCRRKGLLAYFGEVPSWTMCQNCDFW